jgi:hypothetical protein
MYYVFTQISSFFLNSLIFSIQKKLSDKEHFIENDKDQLSEHNPDYDHEAFLGVEEAESFKNLTPEESEEKLGYFLI